MLTLKTKAVRFEWTDDDVESVVTLSSEDDEATLLRKLKRVIALVEGGQEPRAMLAPLPVGPSVMPGPVTVEVPPVTGNGWAAMPEVPPRLQGEVELIEPGEPE